ncbi:MAG: hypothetical protein ACRDUA_00520 [Micromonosporaceae bacterium]
MSLSCLRLRVLLLLGIAFFGYMVIASGQRVATGQLPDTSPARLLGVAAIGLVLVGLLVLLVGGLTARVLLDDDGVHLAWFSNRRSFGWDEIDDITLSMRPVVGAVSAHVQRQPQGGGADVPDPVQPAVVEPRFLFSRRSSPQGRCEGRTCGCARSGCAAAPGRQPA